MSKKQNNAANLFPHREAEKQAKPNRGRVKKALKAGPHSDIVSADGSSFIDPHKHQATSGGNGGGN
jgi:hypothetical protein